MPREQLLGLAADVDRVLVAGAGVADGDVLRRRSQTLRELGKKVPALVPIADAVDRVTSADAPAPAFLDLLVMTRQVRASLATSGAEGELTPLPESGPWRTAIPVRELEPVREVLTQSGSGREERIRDAVERNRFGDLRLVTALFDAVTDTYSPVADAAAESGLPALGHAALGELRRGLSSDGKAADARRLRAICRIDPATGAALCRQLLADGNPTMRAEAVARLAETGGDEAEKVALEHREDRNREVRVAAARGLWAGKTDLALEALFAAVNDKEPAVQAAAVEALGASRHSGAAALLFAELKKAIQALPEAASDKPPVARARRSKGPGSKVTEDQQSVFRADRLIQALRLRQDGDPLTVCKTLLPLLQRQDLRPGAMEALHVVGRRAEGFQPVLVKMLADPESEADALALLTRLPAEKRKTAVPTLVKRMEDAKADMMLRIRIQHMLVEHLDGARKPVLRFAEQVLNETVERLETYGLFFHTLVKMGAEARQLLPAILGTLRRHGDRLYNVSGCHAVLASVEPAGEKSIPVLVEMLDDAKKNVKLLALFALAAYGPTARAALPAVERFTTSKDFNLLWAGKNAVQALG
jgi:HEAT repeat protein